MKTLSAALQAAHAGVIQQPAWLVEIAFSTPLRLSSHSDVTYGGNTYTAGAIDVSRVSVAATRVGGSLVIGNADDLAGTLVLTEGVADRAIYIYGYDAAATDSADIVAMVSCVGGRAQVSTDRVVIDLRDSAEYTATPRQFVNQSAGFTYLLPAGASLKLNGQTYKIERR